MNDTNTQTDTQVNELLHRVKFCILIILQTPSIIVSLVIFVFFYTHRTLLYVRQNQALLILLVVNFVQVTIDLPMVIHFYQLNRVSPATSAYCTWWTFLEFTLNGSGEMLMAVISIQRHLLVFHSHLLRVRSYRLLLHHFPLLFCIVYPIILYLIIVVFYPCDGTQWDYSSNVCGLASCYLIYSRVLGVYDWAVDNGLPVVIISLANAALVVRVVRQKRRRHQLVSWRKQRRMTIQLLSISCLYLLAWFPSLSIGVVQQLFIPTFMNQLLLDYLFDLTYLICLLVPWVSIGLFPEFKDWIRKRFTRRNMTLNTVGPTNNIPM